ncbi:hypothetical protein CCAX7_21850 [Capsulimonas corticalis]|uniref:Uncharacterized protein n=1 Tax=Capsulimonas corticalis TaxID=2219043 RepID=A0A402D201_9BACT|nr:hypothetical protein [Capsulimonas corticalis]BDI30134.1 hypothetical protein CCAX7_21850 [Capsulimonas corticalis]
MTTVVSPPASLKRSLAIPNTNDGSAAAPALRIGMNSGTTWRLPDFSAAPRGTEAEVLRGIRDAGFASFQGGNPDITRSAGLVPTGGGRVNAVGEAGPLARSLREQGCDCATLHVGWGFEDDDQIDRIVEDILAASVQEQFPLYIETHRATITQDLWRTVKLVERFPEIRFNGDFSHWYTGLEMVYGDFEKKLEFIAPVFARVRFLHGRIGNPGCMQVAVHGANDPAPYVAHFREMWTRSMMGFLRGAAPGDYLTFAPELLIPDVYYARTFPNASGQLVEECDRWEQGLIYAQIAKECWAAAQQRLESETAQI